MHRPAGASAFDITDHRPSRRPAEDTTATHDRPTHPRARRWISLVLAWSTLFAAFASVAAAAPPTPSFGRTIDGYASYQGQSTCDPSAKPGVTDFRALFLATYPNTGDSGIGRACDVGGQSEHKEGRAWDWRANVGVPGERAAVDDALRWLLATDRWGNSHALARRFGIMYMIWNRQVWKAYPSDGRPAGSWHPYNGASPHTDHVHFSFSWAGARRQTTWWNAGGTNPPPPPPPPSEADGSALVVDPAGNIWFAAVKTDGTLYTRRFDVSAGTWNTFTSHGGDWSRHAAPALAAQADGTMRLLAVKSNGHLWSKKWVAGTGWTNPSEQGSGGWATDAGPTAVTRPSGEITFAAVKATGELFTRSYTPSSDSWSDFAQHGEGDWSNHAAPGLIAGTDGRLWLFAVKGSGKMFHRTYVPGSGWSSFHEDGAGGWSNYAGPVGTARPGGSITLAAVKGDGSLYTRSLDAATGAWSGFALHGEGGTWSPFASPAITTTTDGHVWLFAVKQGGVIYHQSYEPGGWGPFYEDSYAWSRSVAPVAAARPNGGLTWSSTKDDGVLYTRSLTGSWSGFHAHSSSWAN